jgi:predicted nucleic acid-binding protein
VRVFLDANVLFTAAHNPEGLSRLLFDLGRHKVVTLISSHLAVDEARSNLRLKAPDRAPALDPLVSRLEIVDTPSLPAPVLRLPDDDQLIFAAALAARATHFLTGDKKHFGRYFEDPSRTGGVTIQTVRTFFSDGFGLKG